METLQIINGLLTQPTYYRRVIAHIQEDYFDDPAEILVVQKIKQYTKEYNKQASPADVRLMIQNDMEITDGETSRSVEVINSAKILEPVDEELLFKETEKFAQERSFENILRKGVELMQGKEEKGLTKGMLPDLFRQALSVSFSLSLGHDYFRDAPKRYDYYTNEEEVIKLDVEAINKAFGGGLRRKALYVPLGRTNIGKCVVGETKITVRNKKTGKIEMLTMENLLERERFKN